MAGRTVRRVIELPPVEGVVWRVIENPAEALEEQLKDIGSALEDSELTITVEWKGIERGCLASGLLVQEPIVQAGTVDLHVISLQSYVGELNLRLLNSHGLQIGAARIPVKRRKLASDVDLEILERHWVLTRLPIGGTISQRITGPLQSTIGTPSTPQWAMMVSTLVRPLRTAGSSIRRKPKHALEGAMQQLSVRKIRRASASTTLSMMQGARTVHVQASSWSPDRGAQSMAARDARTILRHLHRLRETVRADTGDLDPILAKEFARIEGDLRALSTMSWQRVAKPRQAVLHDSRYRIVHRAATTARRSATIGSSKLQGFRPPTSDLYEHWCAWALAEELADPDLLPSVLAALGNPTEAPVLLRRKGPRISLSLQYDMAVGRWHHKPDLVLRVESRDRVVILDVKYRGEGPGLASVPPDAIHELHRYRDAFVLTHPRTRHKEVWAAILHPAPGLSDKDWTPERLYNLVRNPGFRIGGIPLAPSLREPLRDYLIATGLLDPTTMSALDGVGEATGSEASRGLQS